MIRRILRIILPAIFIALLVCAMQGGKNILDGIYIIFPVIYIATVLMNEKWDVLVSLVLTSIAFIIPINLLYNMGSCIDLLVIYNVIAGITYLIKTVTRKKKDKKND
jgi:hypothetical protein